MCTSATRNNIKLQAKRTDGGPRRGHTCTGTSSILTSRRSSASSWRKKALRIEIRAFVSDGFGSGRSRERERASERASERARGRVEDKAGGLGPDRRGSLRSWSPPSRRSVLLQLPHPSTAIRSRTQGSSRGVARASGSERDSRRLLVTPQSTPSCLPNSRLPWSSPRR